MTTTQTHRSDAPDETGGSPWGALLRNRLIQFILLAAAASVVVWAGVTLTGNAQSDDPPPGTTLDGSDLTPPVQRIIPPIEGATRLTGIVPVGYPQTEGGAVAAATNYLTIIMGSPAMLDAGEREQALATAVDPADLDTVSDQLTRLYDDVASTLDLDAADEQVIYRMIPGAYRIDSYDGSRAVVSIWHETLAGVPGLASTTPITATYATATITLSWVNGDWKWDNLTSHIGPWPLGVTEASGADVRGLEDVMVNFTPYTYGAVTS